ncbi:hypothetical protein [Roseateles violae]|uniref:Uncharacterized protein n=1 Tax=Roseateles violae TaxID=3058042 RepID=A0ABT8DS48_9BURK|nr:hypothetical protein [Pelomonas sp. PFR6]MDN3919744.1 hypothetical protein [Pelomonas sp. PFR6]
MSYLENGLKRMGVLLVLVAAGTLGGVNAKADEFDSRVNPKVIESNGSIRILFNGEIKNGDAESIVTLHDRAVADIEKKNGVGPQEPPKLTITSPGGNVAEAMAIGRWIRKMKGTVYVPFDSPCFSSCVYVVAAGYQRYIFGDIGIHRPFLNKLDNESPGKILQAILVQSRAYFFEMGVPERLADDMFSVEPEQNKILSKEQLSAYRLNQPDSGYKEEIAIAEAKRLGISRIEYNKRRAGFLKDLEVCELLRPESVMSKCASDSAKRRGID